MNKKQDDLQRLLQERFGRLKQYKTKTGRQKTVKETDERLSGFNMNDPYWEHKSNKENNTENMQSNPDVLEEAASLWYQDKGYDEYKLDIVKKEYMKLTVLQRQVLQLCGFEGRSFDNAAVKLNVSKGTVQKIIERLRLRFKRKLK